jgi:hypothetical protein
MDSDESGMRDSRYRRLGSAGQHVVNAAADVLILLQDLPPKCRSAAVAALDRVAQLAPEEQRLLVEVLRATFPAPDE